MKLCLLHNFISGGIENIYINDEIIPRKKLVCKRCGKVKYRGKVTEEDLEVAGYGLALLRD